MLTFVPLTKEEIGRSPGVAIGKLYENEVTAIKEVISKIHSGGDYLQIMQGVGKYGMSTTALRFLGYINVNNVWSGKNGFDSTSSFLNSEHTQEQAMNVWLLQLYNDSVSAGIITDDTNTTVTSGLLISAYFLGAEATKTALTDKNTSNEWVDLYTRMGTQAISVLNQA